MEGGEVSATTGTAITATGDNSKVTVSGGTVSGGGGSFIIDMGASNTTGVTVSGTGKVEATGTGTAIYTAGSVKVDGGEVSATTGKAIDVEGAGSKVTVSGGTVSGSGSYVIYMYNMSNTGDNVTVSGTGKVEATGSAMAIFTFGNVEVDGGEVTATSGTAINGYGATSKVTVSGGTVSSSASTTIFMMDALSTTTEANVIVSGTGIVQATGSGGKAIESNHNVEVSDQAQVIASTGSAIEVGGASSKVTVSGGTVSGGGISAFPVINMLASSVTGVNVTVSGTGIVQATGSGGIAIHTFGNVEVSGGTVSATTSTAISTSGLYSTVTVSGGTVSGGGSYVISMGNPSATGVNVTVNGTGIVQATGSGTAIYTYGGVEVKDQAQVIATTGKAIDAEGASSTVKISGTGIVEATDDTGTAISTYGDVEVSDGGIVSATTGTAIDAEGDNSTVTVSGGTVSATDHAITSAGTSSMVTVSAGKVEVTSSNGKAILTNGNVEVDGGTVSSDSGTAIYATGTSSTVTVSGGTVSGGGNIENPVIDMNNSGITGSDVNVTVSGSGNVVATQSNGIAISTHGSVVVDGGNVSSTTGTTIEASGDNSKVTVSGGVVSSDSGTAIDAEGAHSTVSVSGTGYVAAKSDGIAISTSGSVVMDGGNVSAVTGIAIAVTGATSTITVSGGTVSAIAGTAISAQGASSTITVSGTGIVQTALGTTIITSGSVEVDGGEVIAYSNKAIDAEGASSTVTVSGGTVSGQGSYVIYAPNNATGVNVTVSGTGIVKATVNGGTAIYTNGNVEVSDEAQVSATTGGAIDAAGDNSTVTVSGGTVSATTAAIYTEGDNSTVTVSGTGIVKATVNGIAICTNGSVVVNGGNVIANLNKAIDAEGASSTVTVSGGTVSATTGYAIFAAGVGSTVTVSGGLVFAYGDVIVGDGNVIYLMNNPTGFTEATGTGVVIAWNQGAGNTTYSQGNSSDIAKSPASATAVWDTNGTDFGIAYANGANAGFIPLSVRFASTACDIVSVESPTGASINEATKTITASVASSVTSQAVSVTVSPDASWKLYSDADCTDEIATQTMALSPGDNTAYIQVTAEDGATTKIYTIVVTRAYSLSVSPASMSFASAAGEQQTFSITSNTDWEVVSDQPWLTVSPASGSNDGFVTLTVDDNTATTTQRTATITVSGTGVTAQTVGVTQAGRALSTACDIVSVESPTGASINEATKTITASVASSVASQAVSVTTSPDASWKLYSDAACTDEIADKTMTLSPGDNTAYIQVTAEDGVTTKTYTIVVTRAYSLSVSTASLDFVAGGGQQTFSITSNTNWTVVSDQPWLTVSPASGSNDGEITLTAEANTAVTQRTATVTVSGTGGVAAKTVGVTQAGRALSTACNIVSVESPTGATITGTAITASVASSVASQAVSVTVSPAASWKLYSNAACTDEIADVTMPLAGGYNTAYIQVTAEDGATTKTYTITVFRNYSLTVSPASLDFVAGGEEQTFSITSNTSWTVVSDQSWLTVSPASGSNDGVITLTADANTTFTQRTATITVNGTGVTAQTISVTQEMEIYTSVQDIHHSSLYAYFTGNTLRIESSYAEKISIYSVKGVLLYTTDKSAGMIEIPYQSIPGSVYIIRGSQSGTVKIVR